MKLLLDPFQLPLLFSLIQPNKLFLFPSSLIYQAMQEHVEAYGWGLHQVVVKLR